MRREVVEPLVQVTAVSDRELRVHVEAPAYVYYFHMMLPDEQAQYSDNYFDLAAGESVDITITGPSIGLKPESLACGWR